MENNEKKIILLLKSIIFHYHGLDEKEKKILYESAVEMDAIQELEWTKQFISEDYNTAFDRARIFFASVVPQLKTETKLSYLDMVWKANSKKGYITEMEANAIIKLAIDWNLEDELIQLVKN